MNWPEVTIVNSDLQIPIDKKFGRIYDTYPRGVTVKTASGSAGNQSEPSMVFEINGASGYVTSIRSIANTASSSSILTSGTVEVILDDIRHYAVKSSYYGNNNVTASLSVNLNQDIISSLYSPDDDITVVRGDQSIILNFPLRFKYHMVIKVIESTSTNPGYASWSWEVDYMIETGGDNH